MRYQHHIFVCTNQKAEGKACCGAEHGMELVEKFREAIIERGLKGKVRAQKSGCLDACKSGPVVVIYPSGVYYGGVKKKDVSVIIDQHIIKGEIVVDKELTFDAEGKQII